MLTHKKNPQRKPVEQCNICLNISIGFKALCHPLYRTSVADGTDTLLLIQKEEESIKVVTVASCFSPYLLNFETVRPVKTCTPS